VDPLRLIGTWDFEREVHDHRDGAEYTARGAAELTLEDDGRVRWTEHGTLSWAAGSTPVTRTLFLVGDQAPVPDGGAGESEVADVGPSGWRVTFEDGRDFHPWTAGAVEHLCGRDLYAGGVRVPAESAPSWEVRWRVTGPEKDYTMETWYSRA
jgi:hypothetical protein